MKQYCAIIIDDERNIREALGLLLTEYCPEIQVCGSAASANEGRELLKKHEVDFIFLDISMPGEDGFAFLKSIPKENYGVIFVTAYQEYALKALKASAIDILPNINVPTVTTTMPSNITQITFTCGGDVTSDGDSPVTARGVCWGTAINPTLADLHTSDGAGTGVFVSQITSLQPNTPYFARAYATNSAGTAYGKQVYCTTFAYGAPCPGMPTFTYGGQVYNTGQIGTQCWMKENLNIGTRVDGNQEQTNTGTKEKYCYDDLETNCDVYGVCTSGVKWFNISMEHPILLHGIRSQQEMFREYVQQDGICRPMWNIRH